MAGGSILFDGVWKKFYRGERHDSLKDLVPSLVKGLFNRVPENELREQEFWAIQDVSFEVKAGEALGIIGPNGAGKSTALKLLTKILRPTHGHCQVKGRLGALIEIAAGFHPDLTGRENIFLQGAILGMRRADVLKKFDAIVDFAGVGEFIDTPVKRYSSGMNARLGFAIAVNLDPEVLVIDEVLSVGDMAFQERCVQQMREFKKRGVAIVFVSHNLQAVSDLCERALYLNRSTQSLGATADVLDAYVRSRSAYTDAEGSSKGAITAVSLVNAAGKPVQQVEPGTDLVLQVEYALPPSVKDLTFGILLQRSTDGLIVYNGNYSPAELGFDRPRLVTRTSREGDVTTARVDYHLKANVTRGHYHFECYVYDNVTQQHLHRIRAAHLSVHEYRTYSGVADLGVKPVTHPFDQPARSSVPATGR